MKVTMKNIPLLVGTLVFTVLLVVGASFLFANSSEPKVVDQTLLVNETASFKGPKEAKVTIVEFSDFQCRGCKGSQPLIQQVLQKYPNDVRLVYRHFPLTTIHKNALVAAEAAVAAARFNKFWELHDLLFADQEQWVDLDSGAFRQYLDTYLDKLQIDKNEFQMTIENQEVKDQVTADISDGTNAGVSGTPTFYVNGQQTAAPQLLSTVESLLQSK